jgi:hypothetical protein
MFYSSGKGNSVDVYIKDIHEDGDFYDLFLQESIVKNFFNANDFTICRTDNGSLVVRLDPGRITKKTGNKGGDQQTAESSELIAEYTADKGNKTTEQDKRKALFGYEGLMSFHAVQQVPLHKRGRAVGLCLLLEYLFTVEMLIIFWEPAPWQWCRFE